MPVLLVLITFLSTLSLAAQPNVQLWWNPQNKADTIMDFGVTLVQQRVTVTFTVVNNENNTVAIYSPQPNAEPFYQIVSVPGVDPADASKEEFEAEFEPSYFIPARSQRSFGVVFRSLPHSADFPVDSVAEGWLKLRVVDSNDVNGLSTNKNFRLRALKTTRILASNTPHIKFDSVYVSATDGKPYTLQNVTPVKIPIQSQILDMQTSVTGTPEIEVDTLPQPAEFGPNTTLDWDTRYRPRDKGRDSAHFLVLYKANAGATPDTAIAKISGIGVEQKLRVVRAISNGAVVVRGDTVDFGNVDADGTGGVVAIIEIRNEGNINVHINSETEIGPEIDTVAFKVERSLSSDTPAIETNAIDTLVVRFDPVQGGVHKMSYDIVTDLRTRAIHGVPDGAQTKRLTFTGFARSPQMSITPPSIEFGNVVLLPTCESASEREFVIRNSGNVDLRVDSMVVQPKGAQVFVDGDRFIVGTSETHTVRVRYIPNQIETLSADLVLYTNAFGPPYAMRCNGASVPPDTISISIAPDAKARPGSQLQVPVRVDADRVTLAETAHLEISFDPTLLRHRISITSGTASEGSLITESEDPRGLLEIDIKANGSFSSDTILLNLLFDTFLGDKATTELGLSESTTRFGNAGCGSILDVHATAGLFAIDSVCGLEYKTQSGTLRTISLDIAPNPVTEDARILISSHLQTDAVLTISDAFGQIISQDAVSLAIGLNIFNLTPNANNLKPNASSLKPDVYNLSPGCYFLEINSGVYRHIKPFVVKR